MKLYRVFPWDGHSQDDHIGGPFFVNRLLQGGTRHGIPHLDGVLYASMVAVAAIAERLQEFRGQRLEEEDLVFEGRHLSLASFETRPELSLLDFTHVEALTQWKVDPLEIATRDRAITQRLAERLFEEGAPGFLWWSSLEARWTNASLFQSRCSKYLSLETTITPLHVDQTDVQEAARLLGISLKRS